LLLRQQQLLQDLQQQLLQHNLQKLRILQQNLPNLLKSNS
jgi:hypothetical protein